MNKTLIAMFALGCLAAFGASADAEKSADDAAGADGTEQQLTVEGILNRDPEKSDYVVEDMCLSMSRIRQMDVIDDRHLAIEYGRDKYYLIQFEHRCRDLQRNRPVYLERTQSRLCSQDRIWGVRDTGFGYERGMPCRIPGFQSVSKEQIVLLKDQLKAERRKRREERKRRS